MEKYITPDILKVKALDNYMLEILFTTNEKKIYNMKELIEKNLIYKNLKDVEYFKKVRSRGETVEWENGEDVCPEELYYNSKPIKKTIKIEQVYPKNNYILLCKFENGQEKIYDMKTLMDKYPIFKKLKDNTKLFNQVIVDNGGYGISWNDEIDLSVEEIWENGEDVYPEKLYYNSKPSQKQ